MDLTSLYYDKFLTVFLNHYRQTIKQAKPGHCMKVTGFALRELRRLIEPMRDINPNVRIFILSDEETGSDFIHASKLIELRNDAKQALLVLVPVNSRTSAEDSYGDATFKDLAIDEDVKAHFRHELVNSIPETEQDMWNNVVQPLLSLRVATDEEFENYLLFMEQKQWTSTAWGEGLICLGLLPDSKLVEDTTRTQRRFTYNVKCSDMFCDFSTSLSDKAQSLPVPPDTIQRDTISFFMKEPTLSSRKAICERIYEAWPSLWFSAWVIKKLEERTEDVKVYAELVPGKDSDKELVKDVNNDHILQLKPGKKGKVKVKMTFSPTPNELPELQRYQVQLVSQDGYVVRDELRNAKLNISGKSKTATINIPHGAYEDGTYFLRIHALDTDGVQLDFASPFAEDAVQAEWEEYQQLHAPGAAADKVAALKEQFQQENDVLCINETTFFTIKNADEDDADDVETGIDKRKKISNMLQAYFHYQMELLRKKEDIQVPVLSLETEWKVGTLNDVYTFDFGNAAYAYQIQNSRKLLELERAFYKHSTELGSVYAEVSGNPTDNKLQDWRFNTLPQSIQVSQELLELRKNIFSLIQNVAPSETGVLSIFPIFNHIDAVREYIRSYSSWIDSQIETSPSESETVALQNIDIVDLQMEMPDGSHTSVKMIPPIHPIRLSWLINIYDLFQDWLQKSVDNEQARKQWYKKLDKLFMGDIPMEISPLVLTKDALTVLQYIGEITFGWGVYAVPTEDHEDVFGSEFRQLKSYLTSLLNITRDKQIDSDVNLELVFRYIDNYSRSHVYADKLVINLFNAGDANVFADALVAMERYTWTKDYEIRLFADDKIIQPGKALRDLLDPDAPLSEAADSFAIASANRLFPKLRFSVNSIQDFIDNHDKYQAHLSFLINPFPVKTEMVRPDSLARSFYLNGVIVKSAVSYTEQGHTKLWSRYFSQKSLPAPVDEFANESIVLFGRLEYLIGKTLSSTATRSIPATTLAIHEKDAMLLSFIHKVSDWVVTFDKNMGPEFYDLPIGESSEKPYLLDYIPGQDRSGVSSFLTTLPNSEIEGLMRPQFEQFGIKVDSDLFAELLEDVRAVSSSMVMQTQATRNKAFEVLGITLTKRMLKKKGLLDEAFIIPIDLHKELFENLDSQNKERADSLVVSIDPENHRINMKVIEIKCRQSLSEGDEETLEEKMVAQMSNTIEALDEHFGHSTSLLSNFSNGERLDNELKTMELCNLLSFYIQRARRYNILPDNVCETYLRFLNTLSEADYEINYDQLGIIFNLGQDKKQIKTPFGDAMIYKMGRPVIEDILSSNHPLDTISLDADDSDFINEFPKTLRSKGDFLPTDNFVPKQSDKAEVEDIPSVIFPEEQEEYKRDAAMVDVSEENETSELKPSAPVVANLDDIKIDDIANNEQESYQQNDNAHVEDGSNEGSSYEKPNADIFIGSEDSTPQYGILGCMQSNNRKIALDLNGCNTISLFGRQGAGKSYTIGVVSEMTLRQFSNVNVLPAPLASVIFHFSETMDYAPEFTSMIYPNDEAKQLAKLKAVYGAEAGAIEDIVLLTTESKLSERQAEYPNLEVHPIAFDSKELQVMDWMFLLGAVGNDSTYIKEFKQILKKLRGDLNLKNIKNGVKGNLFLSQSQKQLAEQRINFASEYIQDGMKLREYLKPGRLVIVDVRDEFIEKEEALGLFVVMLNIFSGAKTIDGKAFNKFIVFDEAHKYMDDKRLVNAITTAIREMRHKGVSIMIASQDPVKLAPEIIELSSVIILHCFNSPAWVQHMKKAVTALGNLSAPDMANLSSGEAYLWASKSSDKVITTRPVKILIRPRVTKHGGDTIQASNE